MAPNRMAKRSHSTGFRGEAVVFLVLLSFRLANAYYLQTFFQPDEYFQALEPAWQMAYGPSSGAWITWEWREGLRTSVHPFLFAAVYKTIDQLCHLLKLNGPAQANALIAGPRILQAFWAASLDLLTWRFATKVYGSSTSTSFAALMLTTVSPWQWYCSTRTFSNTLEAMLTVVALHNFPWQWYLEPEKDDKAPLSLASLTDFTLDFVNLAYVKHALLTAPTGLLPALTTAAMAFYFRPTNLMIWIAISLALVGCNRNYRKALVLLQNAVIVGLAVVGVFATADQVYYGSWTLPPLRFVYFNVVQSLAVFYGKNRIDYYFTEGLPLLLTTALPFAAIGIWNSIKSSRTSSAQEYVEMQTRFVLAFAVLITILSLSSIGHKEVRFISPLLPMLHILAAKPFASFFSPLPLPRSTLRQLMLAFLIATNIYVGVYVGMTHQRGVVDVMHYLRHRQEDWVQTRPSSNNLPGFISTNVTAGFLMPCHSTPWRSHLVYPDIKAWALTCEPPINLAVNERASYLDEADVFYADPSLWIERNMQDLSSISASIWNKGNNSNENKRQWPHYLIFFEHLEPNLKGILAGSRYKECRRFFNTHWHDDGRRKGDVVVWCMRR